MQIKFSEDQMEQALLFYAMIALGVPSSSIGDIEVTYSSGSYKFQCEVKDLKIPTPVIKKQEISQEEVDKIYSTVMKRQLDVS